MNPDWSKQIKVGVSKDGSYYKAVKFPSHPKADKKGYVYSHRVVMEQVLGRFLDSSEIIHHKDGNKLNNDPSNLEVLTASQHSKTHKATGRHPDIELTCDGCGTEFKREWRNRPALKKSASVFCSNKCRAINKPPPSQLGKTWKQRKLHP